MEILLKMSVNQHDPRIDAAVKPPAGPVTRRIGSQGLMLLRMPNISVLVCAVMTGCQPGSATPAAPAPKAAAKPAGPSKVIGGVKEADLTKVELTEDAEKRLGILPGGLVAVERKPIDNAVSYPGEVMIPSGHLISVTSPFPATLKAPNGAMVPQPGAIVTLGQTIFLMEPNLSPGERADLGFRSGRRRSTGQVGPGAAQYR